VDERLSELEREARDAPNSDSLGGLARAYERAGRSADAYGTYAEAGLKAPPELRSLLAHAQQPLLELLARRGASASGKPRGPSGYTIDYWEQAASWPGQVWWRIRSLRKIAPLLFLGLSGCGLRDGDLAPLAGGETLEQLQLDNNELEGGAGLACLASLQRVTYLSLARNSALVGGGLGEISALSSLMHLDLSDCPGLDSPSLVGLAPPRLRELELLRSAGDEHLAALPALPALTRLGLGGRAGPGARGLADLARHAGLRELEVWNPLVDAPQALAALGGVRSLESLSLGGPTLGAQHLRALRSNESLTHLRLHDAPGIDAEALSSLAELGLRSLEIKECDALKGAGLAPLETLRELTLDRSDDSTGLALAHLVNLEVLRLSGLPQMGVASLGDLERLRVLEVDFLGDKDLSKLPDSLEDVHLIRCTITDATLRSLALLPRLRSLKLSASEGGLSQAGIEALRSERPNLRLEHQEWAVGTRTA
jgi:Leucine-rich repeat (LRR) protein